jgi:hypothetical protein
MRPVCLACDGFLTRRFERTCTDMNGSFAVTVWSGGALEEIVAGCPPGDAGGLEIHKNKDLN